MLSFIWRADAGVSGAPPYETLTDLRPSIHQNGRLEAMHFPEAA